MEVRLSFGCLVRKEVRFLELSAAENVIEVNKKLWLLVTTFVPSVCEIGAKEQAVASPRLREFAPKWVRIGYARGRWIGDYGL